MDEDFNEFVDLSISDKDKGSIRIAKIKQENGYHFSISLGRDYDTYSNHIQINLSEAEFSMLLNQIKNVEV